MTTPPVAFILIALLCWGVGTIAQHIIFAPKGDPAVYAKIKSMTFADCDYLASLDNDYLDLYGARQCGTCYTLEHATPL